MSFLGNYVESQWALATFTVPPESACICAFSGGRSSVVGNFLSLPPPKLHLLDYFMPILKLAFEPTSVFGIVLWNHNKMNTTNRQKEHQRNPHWWMSFFFAQPFAWTAPSTSTSLRRRETAIANRSTSIWTSARTKTFEETRSKASFRTFWTWCHRCPESATPPDRSRCTRMA